MEIYHAILISLLVGVASTLLSAALNTLILLCAYVLAVQEQAQVSALDRLLAETGWCSARKLGPGRLPADGVHFAFLRGPLIAVRSSETLARGGSSQKYTVYAIGSAAASAIHERLTGDPRDVVLRYVYAPAPWRSSSVTMRCAPPPRAHPWQNRAVRKLFERFRNQSRATALVCGSMGAGKSTLGELLAVAIKTEMRLIPEVVKNLDLTSKGLLLEDAFDTPTSSSPVILMLDEVDATIDHAERAETKEGDKREGASLADTPTSLLAVLDRLNRTPHLVVIATTNKALTAMTAGGYARYTRKGRLDLRFEV